jgi:hypothetical protein
MITHHVNRFFDYAQSNGYSDEKRLILQLYNCTTRTLYTTMHEPLFWGVFFLSCTTFFIKLPFPRPNIGTTTGVGFDRNSESLGKAVSTSL